MLLQIEVVIFVQYIINYSMLLVQTLIYDLVNLRNEYLNDVGKHKVCTLSSLALHNIASLYHNNIYVLIINL